MLSWKLISSSPRCWSAKTALGTAMVYESRDGPVTLDMWRDDQTSIGKGTFSNVDVAKTRAETILDPRATAWDVVLGWCDNDDLILDFDEAG